MERKIRILSLFAAAIALSTLAGCSTVAGTLKADPAKDSGFLTQSELMSSGGPLSPFQRLWINKDAFHSGRYTEIAVAPVDISRVRPVGGWTKLNYAGRDLQSDAQELADFTRSAFLESVTSGRRFRAVEQPGPKTLILEIAFVELVPTKVVQSIAGTTAGIFLPGGGLIGTGSKGSAAVEARMIAADTGEVVMMFADRERGKIAPFSFRDYLWFSHARNIVSDWSEQWHAVCAGEPDNTLASSLPITLMPW